MEAIVLLSNSKTVLSFSCPRNGQVSANCVTLFRSRKEIIEDLHGTMMHRKKRGRKTISGTGSVTTGPTNADQHARDTVSHSAARVQSFARRYLERRKLGERFMELKKARVKFIVGILNCFSFADAQRRIESYTALINAIEDDLTFQDVLNQVLSLETLQDMHKDLFSEVHELRVIAARFMCDFGHLHPGNQRMLCMLNGLTVGNIRLISVSSRFEMQHKKWCEVNGFKVTYEGLLKYIEGVVLSARDLYVNINPVQSDAIKRKRKDLRSSLFSYPQVVQYEDLDPYSHLIGLELNMNEPIPELEKPELNVLAELRQVFEMALTMNGNHPKDLFNNLVPSVPMYALLLAIQSVRENDKISEDLNKFFNEVELFDHLQIYEPLRPDVITNDLISTCAKSGYNALWGQIAEKCAKFIVEEKIKQRLGEEFLDQVHSIFKRLVSPASSSSMQVSRACIGKRLTFEETFIPRLRLIQALKEFAGRFKGLLDHPKFLWHVLGLLRREDHVYSKSLCGYASAPDPAFGVRTLVQSLESDSIDFGKIRERYGDGRMNWDWISWSEFAFAIRKLLCPPNADELLVIVDKYVLNRTVILKAQKDKESSFYLPSSVSSAAGRVRVVQRMLRNLNPHDYCRKESLEAELALLRKVLAKIDPNLSPVCTSFHEILLRTKNGENDDDEEKEKEEKEEEKDFEGIDQDDEIQQHRRQRQEILDRIKKRRERKMKRQAERHSKFVDRHKARCEEIRQRQQQEEQARQKFLHMKSLEWANERIKREKAHLIEMERISQLRRKMFFEHETIREERAATEEAIHRFDEIEKRLLHENEKPTGAEEKKQRVNQFDLLVQLRNQLVSNQLVGAKPGRVKGQVETLAEKGAPIWTLCDTKIPKEPPVHLRRRKKVETKAKEMGDIAMDKDLCGGTEVVGGYLMRKKDVQEIRDKIFSVDELKNYCDKFPKDITQRQQVIISQYLYSKKMVEISMGINLELLDFTSILADLQFNDCPPVITAAVAAEKARQRVGETIEDRAMKRKQRLKSKSDAAPTPSRPSNPSGPAPTTLNSPRLIKLMTNLSP